MRRAATRAKSLAALAALVGAALATAAGAQTTTTTAPSSTTTTVPATSLGPDGVVSAAMVAENDRHGSMAWLMPPGDVATVVQGFADHNYAAVGQSVGLYVTTTAARYRVTAYRMGWYHGAGARRVWHSGLLAGVVQPPCALDTTTNTVGCDSWHRSLTVTITSAFVPGDYLFKLNAGPKAQSYIPLTVWDPTSTAAYVIMNRSMVEEGWNPYGGYDLYGGTGPCILDAASYPPCNRSRVVSFDRPYAMGHGASDFLTNEYPLVYFCEEHGLDVTYISDVTLSEHPNLLDAHRALLSLDHDEMWTYDMRLAVHSAVAHGVNVVFFGAAAMVRHARLQASPLGPDREVVDYRDGAEDPLNGVANPLQVTGNTWYDAPADWPPVSQIGVNYSGYLSPYVTVPMVVADGSSWVFTGTGLGTGASLAGVIGSDFDHAVASGLEPADLQVLAHSPIPAGEATVSGGTWGGYSYSDMVYFTDPVSQAGTIDTGNNVWIADLSPCPRGVACAAPVIARITGNILRAFGLGPAGRAHPPAPNRTTIVPVGT